MRWRAHWIAPNHVSAHEESAYRKTRDQKSNEESRVDSEEELRVFALWGVEIFGPNEIDGLYESLKSLGWTAGYRGDGDGALTWVQEQRAYGQGGFYNVGVVTRNSDRQRFLPETNLAPLPDDADYLVVHLYQVVPALTSAVVCFVLKEEAASRYERELNLDRRSWRERGPRWRVRLWEPGHVKQRAVEAARARHRRMVYEWFGKNLPGYFTGLTRKHRFPTAELLATKSKDIFSGQSTSRFFDWKRILANVADPDIWTSKDVQGLRFAMQSAEWPREEENVMTVSLCLQAVPQDRLMMYGGGPHAIAHICHEAVDGAMSYFAVLAFLKEVARDLKVTREELNLSKTSRKSLRTIERIQRFFDRNAGVPAVARELREDSKGVGRYTHYCGAFTAPPWMNNGAERQLAESLRSAVHSSASGLIEDESSTREHFEQLSTILSIRESIRTQRRMEWLTVIALVVATLSLIAAIPDLWIQRLKVLWSAMQL